MTPRRVLRPSMLIVLLALGTLVASGCTADPSPPDRSRSSGGNPLAGGSQPALRLAAYSSCADALAKLRDAAKEAVGPYGFLWGMYGGGMRSGVAFAEGDMAARQAVPLPQGGSQGGSQPGFSGTNTHEAGVDEPDMVKTDGRRILTVDRGVLRVVDARRRTVVGSARLPTGSADRSWYTGNELLLSGDRAVVFLRDVPVDSGVALRQYGLPLLSTDVLLYDISAAPRLLSRYHFDGAMVDARQVGHTARLVLRSAPRLRFPIDKPGRPDARGEDGRIDRNRRLIDRAPIGDWLPRYTVTEAGRTRTGQVGCERLVHPEAYTTASMLTILTFDLSADRLGDGDPLTVVADGETVYGTTDRLYVASDQRWRQFWRGGGPARPAGATPLPKPREDTQIFAFDISGADRPRFLAAGGVPGWLINQYAMSAWDGRLRVATTTGMTDPGGPGSSESAVYVLRADGDRLVEEGRVTGLGRGERIYAVRFVGPVGYVVTFRQTDPLYTVDLRDPANPRVAGELKITGYSAYLHPAGDGRLIGVGQAANAQGRVKGTQISLFDVSDPAQPRRLAQHHVRNGNSEAEFDPHAFLYWPADNLLVVPLSVYGPTAADKPVQWGGALVLTVGDRALTEVGTVRASADAERSYPGSPIRRSLVIDGVLWTLSDGALTASDPSTLRQLARVAL